MKKASSNPKTFLLSGKSQSVALSRVGESTIKKRSIRAAFDEWFIKNYSRLKEYISISGILDDDAFHEAYLSIATDTKLSEKDVDFRKLFLSIYKQATRRTMNESYVICHPDELFFTLLPDTEDEIEESKGKTYLIKTIQTFISSTFTKAQQSVFRMRVQGFSIRDTADCFNLNDRQVKETMNDIVCRTREQFVYAM